MKSPVLFLFASLITLASCSKSDNSSENQIPSFTCDITTDDAQLNDVWNAAEKSTFLQNNTLTFVEGDTHILLDYIAINKSRITYKDSLILTYHVAQKGQLHTLMVYTKDGRVYSSGRFTHDAPYTDFSVGTFILRPNNQGGDTVGMQAGCNRLYYLFTDSTGKALSKGHFDIQYTQ